MVLKLVSWILSTSIYASFCALALTLGAERLLLNDHLPAWNSPLHLLIFGATLLEYNAHFILNTWHKKEQKFWAWLLAALGGILCLISVPALPKNVFILLGCLCLLALAYSAPYIPFRPKRRINDYGITKILVLTITWVAMTTIIPALYLGFKWNALSEELWLRMLLIFPLCLAFDLRDYESDKARGIQTIAGALGEVSSYRLIYINLLILAFIGTGFFIADRISLSHLNAVLVSTVVAFCSVRFARKTQHPFIYPGLIDGVMLLYGVLLWAFL